MNEIKKSVVVHFAGAFLALALLSAPARAYVLDWDSVNWPNNRQWNDVTGAVSTTFNNVDGSGINVTITVTQSNTTNDADTFNPGGTPEDTGLALNSGSLEDALQVDLNADDFVDSTFGNGGDDYLTISITFSATVDFVSYTLKDIDLGNSGGSTYQDSVLFNSSNLPSSLTRLGSNGDGTGSFDAQIVSGNTAIRGIATFNGTSSTANRLGNENDNFTSGNVQVDYAGNFSSGTAFSFEYGSLNGSSVGLSFGNPTQQRIALLDITFTVPEPSTYAAGALLLGAALVAGLRRARRTGGA